MKNFRFSRQHIIPAVLTLAVFGWLVVIGIIVVESGIVQATPKPNTLINVQPTISPIRVVITVTSANTATPIASPTPAFTEISVLPTLEASATSLATAGTIPPSVGPTAVSAQASNGCKRPDGWVAYNVESGDTLFGFVLGSKGQLTVESIMTSNCLTSKFLAVGQTVFLPPGVADQSPKVDDAPVPAPGSGSSGSPSNPSRGGNCPCTIIVRTGWRLEQIAAAVDNTPVSFSGADFMAAVGPGASAPALAVLSSRPGGKSLEGFMFPGTYSLDNGTSAVQFRDMLLNAFANNVGGQIQADAAAHGLTFWEAVVLASIIQRESGAPSEQKLVGSVFHNRLSQGKGLAATVTLQYALGVPGNWWPRVKSVNFKSPYNTYLLQGLPPAPIASPGLDAILAAVYPAQTNYLYFSGKCGGGGNFYAATFAEFEQGLICK